jgi:mannose/fructose/N-acetylgalactosamine-specific phosphotransferase system component IIB
METRVRRYVITMHNYQKEEWTKEKLSSSLTSKWKIDYLIIGSEVTQDNSVPHYQMYVEFTNPTTLKQVIERFSKITQLKPHVEIAKGDGSSNKIYCSKSNDYVEHGSITSQRLRNDDIAVNVIRLIVGGMNPMDLAHSYPEYALFVINKFKNLMDMYNNRQFVTQQPDADDGDLPF